jgi:excisionase family DNA binding protein
MIDRRTFLAGTGAVPLGVPQVSACPGKGSQCKRWPLWAGGGNPIAPRTEQPELALAAPKQRPRVLEPEVAARVARPPEQQRGKDAMTQSEQIKTAWTPQYLTPEAVAQMLRVSPSTVYRWAASDATMPALRVGKTVRFRTDLLERWLTARTQRSRRQQIADQSVRAGTAGT